MFGWGKVGGWEGSSIQLHGPGPGLDAVSEETVHGNTAMLDLGMGKETNGGFLSLLPEVPSGKTHGVIVLDNGVEVSIKRLKISLLKFTKKCKRKPIRIPILK